VTDPFHSDDLTMELTARLELAREALGQADEVPPNSPASLPLSSPQTQTSLVESTSKTKERHHKGRRKSDDDHRHWERHKQREQKRYKLRAEVEERLTEEINRQTQMGVVFATKQQSLERTRKRNQQAHGLIKDIQGELATTLRAQEKAEEELAQLKRKLQKYGSDVDAARQELAKAQEFIDQISHERDDAEEKAEIARKEAQDAVERMTLEQAKAEGVILGRYEGVVAGWENGKYRGYTSARAKALDEERQRIMQRRYELKERYPQLDIDRAFDAVPSPDRSVDGLPLELLEKKAPISPPVFPNLPQHQHGTTPHKMAHEPHRMHEMPRSTSPDTRSELTPDPSPKPSSKPSAKPSKPRRERRRRVPSDPPPPPSSAPPPIERKPRPKTHLPPPRPVFTDREEDVSFHDQLPIEPDKPRPLGRTETFRRMFGGRKPVSSMDEGPQEPIPDVAPFAPSLPFPALATPLPPSRILEPMRGAMSPAPSMRVSPKFRARDVDPTPQQIAEKELRKLERQFAREKNKDKGVLGFVRRISRSKAPTGHRASASMSNIPASATAPTFTRNHHASISNHSLPSQRQAYPHPHPHPSPKPSLRAPLPSPRPSLRHNDLPDGFIPTLGPDGSISLPPPYGIRRPPISREPSPTPSTRRSIHEHSRHNSGRDPSPSKRVIRAVGGSIRSVGGTLKKGASVASHLSHRSSGSKSRSSSPNQEFVEMDAYADPYRRPRADSFRSQRRMSSVPMTQEGLLLPEAIQVLPNEDEDDLIPVPQIDVVPAANQGHGRGRRRVPTGKSAMSTPMSQFSILDKDQGDRPTSQYHNFTKDALGLRLRQGSMSTDENSMDEPTMKSYPSIAGLSVITERSERGLSRSQTQRTHLRSPASTHQTPHVRRVPVPAPRTPAAHGLGAIQNEGYYGDNTGTTGHRRSEDDDDKPPELPMKSPRTKLAAVYNSRPRPANLTVPAPLAPSQTPSQTPGPPPRGGYAGIGAGGGRRTGQGSIDEDLTRPWTILHKRAEVSSPSGRVLVGLD